MKNRLRIGKTFGRFLVAGIIERRGMPAKFLCLCSCGKSKIVDANSVVKGLSRSCGCLHKEILKDLWSGQKSA